jgi:hypothetical protein
MGNPLIRGALCSLLIALPVAAQLPARDLQLDVRQVEEDGGGYVAGTRPQAPLLPPQQLRVRNGETAQMSFMQSIPLQWVQAVNAPGALGGAGVKQGLIWLRAGQSLSLRPRWPGAQQPVTVELEVQTAGVQPSPGAALPTQEDAAVRTTVQAPLGQWVTIARSGQEAPRGSYRSEGAAERPRLLQLRVTAP